MTNLVSYFGKHCPTWLKNQKWFLEWIFLSIVSLIIFLTGLQITPGITPDSVLKYLPISENIYHYGISWFLFNDSYETTIIPPLYEFCTAFLMISGIDAVYATGLVSLISFTILPFPLYYLGKEIGGNILGFLTVILCCIMKPFWENGTSSMTEMLFLVLVIVSICFFVRYISRYSRIDLVLSTVFLVLANWTRWLGITLFLTYFFILIIIWIQKKVHRSHISNFLLISIPFISFLYLRNLFLVGELYASERISFSIPNLVINVGMTGLNIIWDFIGFNPLKTANQTFMDLYFHVLSDSLPLDYLTLFESVHLNTNQFISLFLTLFLIILILVMVFLRIRRAVFSYVKYLLIDKKWILLFTLFITFYLGMYLYTESSTKLSLMDSRYLVPIYPLLIITGLKGLLVLNRVDPPVQRICNILLIILIIGFIIWQSSMTALFLFHIQQGRGFSDPTQMEGPAYQWMKSTMNQSGNIIINDGLRGYFWEKSLNRSIGKMPVRDFPINTYLMEQPAGTYLVITPVIGTKGPYRWSELQQFLMNSSRYSLVLDQKEDRIFLIAG